MKKNQTFSVRIQMPDLPDVFITNLHIYAGDYMKIIGQTSWLVQAVSRCLSELEKNPGAGAWFETGQNHVRVIVRWEKP